MAKGKDKGQGGILKMLKTLVGQVEAESGLEDLTKVFGEEAAEEISKHLDPDAPEEKKIEMINAFAKSLGIEIRKEDEDEEEEEESEEEKPEDKDEESDEKPEDKKDDEKPEDKDAEKGVKVEDLAKRLQDVEDLLKTLSTEGGLTKALTDTTDIIKKAGEAVTKVDELTKSNEDLLSRVTYLEDLRGIRRSGSPELKKGEGPDGGWDAVLAGGATIASEE